MGTQISFTPLLGSLSEGPVSYLLTVDGLTVLLDCGWTDAYDVSSVEPLCEARGPRLQFDCQTSYRSSTCG